MTGTLYVVSTPIGNLEDITLRALRVLREADLIVGEDSRHTRKLLAHYHIHTRFAPSLYQGVSGGRVEELLGLLKAGKDLALVSDAGTPLVSDPGYPLVRAAVEEGIPVVPVPGASALLAALVASGLPPDRFLFLGYLPRRAGPRKRALEEAVACPYTVVAYESPHRILPTLKELAQLAPGRELVLARELTKLHEEFLRGAVREVLAEVERRGGLKGELVLLLAPAGPGSNAGPEPEAVRRRYQELLETGLAPGEGVKRVAEEFGLPRRQAYRLVHDLPDS